MIGSSLFRKGGILLLLSVFVAMLIPSILPTSSSVVYAATACRSDQYKDKKGACVNKVDQPRNAADCPDGTTFQAAGGGNDASCKTTGKDDSPDLSCSVLSFNPLNWVICPVIGLLRGFVGEIDKTIVSMLTVGTDGGSDNPNQIFCDNSADNSVSGKPKKTCSAYYQAWASIRNIALGLMVVAGLVVVIAQALGMELLDAYTIRKVLPRILIAAVGITLSWQLMRFFVVLTNDLGLGIRTLMFAPFSAFPDAKLDVGSQAVLVLVEGSAFVALGALGILSFIGTAALSVLIAYLVLVLRQLAIIILIIFSPIAIVAYILPNTQNIYKLWWDSFAKALIMFPLISAFIAAGRILAVVAGVGTSNPAAQIMGFAAYFAPYFMLPLTFRFAGGFLRTAGGFMNDRSRGGFDRLRNFRGNQTKQNLSRAQQMQRFNPNRGGPLGYVNRRTNSALSAITDPVSAAKIYGGMGLRKAGVNSSMGMGIMNQIDQTKFQHSQKLAEMMNGTMGLNDRALSALMSMDDYSAGSIRAKAAQLSTSENANDRLAANQLNSGATFLAQSLYQDDEMMRADIGMAAGLANTAQGFSSIPEITDLANRRQAGAPGATAAFVTQAQLNGQRAGRLDMKPGYGVQMDADGKYFSTGFKTKNDGSIDTDAVSAMSGEERNRATAHQVKRILSTGQSELQGAKAPSVKAMAPGFEQILKSAGPLNANGKHELKYVNERGVEEKVEFSPQERERVASMLGNAQSSYAGTSAQTSQAIDEVIARSDLGDNPALAQAYASSRRGFDPSTLGGGGGGDQEGAH
jgi:hypothetical protein